MIPSVHPTEICTCVHQKTCPRMSTATLFVRARRRSSLHPHRQESGRVSCSRATQWHPPQTQGARGLAALSCRGGLASTALSRSAQQHLIQKIEIPYGGCSKTGKTSSKCQKSAWQCPREEASDGKGRRGYLGPSNALFLHLGAGHPGVFTELYTYDLGTFLYVL